MDSFYIRIDKNVVSFYLSLLCAVILSLGAYHGCNAIYKKSGAEVLGTGAMEVNYELCFR